MSTDTITPTLPKRNLRKILFILISPFLIAIIIFEILYITNFKNTRDYICHDNGLYSLVRREPGEISVTFKQSVSQEEAQIFLEEITPDYEIEPWSVPSPGATYEISATEIATSVSEYKSTVSQIEQDPFFSDADISSEQGHIGAYYIRITLDYDIPPSEALSYLSNRYDISGEVNASGGGRKIHATLTVPWTEADFWIEEISKSDDVFSVAPSYTTCGNDNGSIIQPL